MACKTGSINGVPVVLRVKRKRTEDPADALVVSKYKKLDPLLQEQGSAVFRFVGTIPKDKVKESEILDCIKHHSDHRSQVKVNPLSKLSISERQEALREEKRVSSCNRRFKVVSKLRSLEEDATQATVNNHESEAKELMKEMVHLCDVEQEDDLQPVSSQEPPPLNSDSYPFVPSDGMDTAASGHGTKETAAEVDRESVITCNSTQMLREKIQPKATAGGGEFVYDLYYTSDHGVGTSDWNTLYIHDYELVHNIIPEDPSEEVYDDEDDSNDENNWRNDYPDEEDSDLDDNHHEYRHRDVEIDGYDYTVDNPDSSYWGNQRYDDGW